MKKFSTTMLLFLFFLGISQAQNNYVFDQINEVKQIQKITEVIDLQFNTRATISSRSKTAKEAVLQFNNESVNKIIQRQNDLISLSMVGIDGEEIPVTLIKAHIFAPGFKVMVSDGNSLFEHDFDPVSTAFYRGIVDGEENSLVSLSFRDGSISGFINSESKGDFGLRKNEDGQNIIVDLSSLDHPELSCSTADDGQGYAPELLRKPTYRAPGDYVSVFIEVESDMTEWQGGVTEVTNYMTGLFNDNAAIYAGDGMDQRISSMQVNTEAAYSTTRGKREIKPSSAGAYLNAFQSAQSSSFVGDLAHLVAFNNVGGVAAGFSGLCNSNRANSMCISGFVSDPDFNLQIFAHELGHLYGSRHTHACVWNGNNTAIDGCSGSTEGTCPLPPPAGQNEGTIMSYCYNNYGLDFDEGFHPQPQAVMLNKIAAATCLMSGNGGGSCFDGVQNGDETGVDCGGSCVACPTCNDGIQNGDETGIDCGGSCPDVCPPVNCEDPSGLAVTDMRKNRGTPRAVLGWNDVADALEYEVQIRTTGTTSWTTFTATESQLSLQGFADGTQYDWQVRTICNGATSNYSGCTFTYVNRGSDVTCGSSASGPATGVIGSENLSVSPNPVSDILFVQLENAIGQNYNVAVFNAIGQRVFDGQLSAGNNWVEVDVQTFDAGLYLIAVTSETSKHVQRVIVN